MINYDILVTVIIVGLSIVMPIYYSRKKNKEKQKSEVMERMLIREYGRKINEKTRNKINKL
ncbi:hypothetical protein OAM12_00745 [Candidatus Pelagibacter sp.]|jgi:hypothetical protein|nr:hypothetical protein [Candidatus Pelagibacter sp.]